MIGLTWLRISHRIQKGKKEFDRQVFRAALIWDIAGRSGAGPDLSMMNFITFRGNIDRIGKAEEYDIINGELLGPLSKAFDAGQDRLFIAPSSHGMDRVVFEKLPSEIKKPPGPREEEHRKM